MNEDAIIRKLRRHAPLIGDDCAVVQAPPNQDLLFTTDFSIEGVHFTRDSSAEQIGHRAVAPGIGDDVCVGVGWDGVEDGAVGGCAIGGVRCGRVGRGVGAAAGVVARGEAGKGGAGCCARKEQRRQNPPGPAHHDRIARWGVCALEKGPGPLGYGVDAAWLT